MTNLISNPESFSLDESILVSAEAEPDDADAMSSNWFKIACEVMKITNEIMNQPLPSRKLRIANLVQTRSVTREMTGWHTSFGSRFSVTHSMALQKLPSSSTSKCLM